MSAVLCRRPELYVQLEATAADLQVSTPDDASHCVQLPQPGDERYGKQEGRMKAYHLSSADGA